MPYDSHHDGYMSALHEYHQKGLGPEQKGMKKNLHVLEFETKQGNEAEGVWHDPTTKPLRGVLGRDVQILIRGHGMPGFRSIQGGRLGGERVSYEEVANRLKQSGLSKAFAGAIICYCCHSAESGKVGTDPEILDGRPFARLFADHMRSMLYRSCSIYGYLGAVDSFPKDGPAGKNYYARGQWGSELQAVLGKASQALVRFC